MWFGLTFQNMFCVPVNLKILASLDEAGKYSTFKSDSQRIVTKSQDAQESIKLTVAVVGGVYSALGSS